MATKTISLELDAYDKLRRAKRSPRESFSAVVRRARWHDTPATGHAVVAALETLARDEPETLLDDAALDRMERRASERTRRRREP